jgi:hypothetical protein
MRTSWMTSGIHAAYLAGATAFIGGAAASAQEVIGVAAVVRNEVDQALATRVIRINAGENITHDEVVKTGPDSAAKLVFSDNTNLAMGPGSTLTLNKFVYSGEHTYEKATFQLVKGAFRFTTGGSDKRAYEIKTPTATIGVRGTAMDILVDDQTLITTVVLQHGAGSVCNSGGCVQLTQVGQTATATSNSVSNTSGTGGTGGTGAWTFSKSVGQQDSSLQQSLLQPTSFEVAMATNASRGDGTGGNGPGGNGPGGSGFGGNGSGGIGAGGGGGGGSFSSPVGTSASPN